MHAGRALFGCHDGYVYCLRADRRPGLAIPGTASRTQGGRLRPDRVSLAGAGQHPGPRGKRRPGDRVLRGWPLLFLDGGMTVLGLDPRSGAVRCSRPLDGPWQDPAAGSTPDNPNRGFTMPGSLPDVMVADADHLYLRQLRFDPSLQTEVDMARTTTGRRSLRARTAAETTSTGTI